MTPRTEHPRRKAPNPTTDTPISSHLDPSSPWLDNFYRECGREVTLAYTTLNQMKNWAMAIIAASISAGVAFARPSATTSLSADVSTSLPVFLVAAIAYIFNLRFFFRAILCYINLTRWNKLQSDILSLKLIPAPIAPGKSIPTREQATANLRQSILHYYHSWLSPIDRKTQILANLKLGFALFLTLPLFFIIIGAVNQWSNYLVRGLTLFVVGGTIVEFSDFATSHYFDDPDRTTRRKTPASFNPLLFPVPKTGWSYLLAWALTLLVSITAAQWPTVLAMLRNLRQAFGS
jgi:hypothetical protein